MADGISVRNNFGRRQRMGLVTRFALSGFGLACLAIGLVVLMSLSMAGFPDGYISPYDRLTSPAVQVLSWLAVLSACYFLVLAFRGARLPLGAALLRMFVAVILIWAPLALIDSCPRWDMCGQAFQAVTGSFIDDGQGG
ncbi:hypothetical protein [Devosia sp. SL43]|uniref:hypothetical protein n=1 Tax=Devosia sp. SL43 TaxID=2806348 RepID=UPI001F22919A|nr:hypothetical protein [Devosia sp. SL43]UJW84668.1 hypothetical protein IM737_14720 [Devosia sp. SL43]